MAVTKPTEAEVRDALRTHAPHLADVPIAFLAEGWEFWAFTAGDYVLRFPRPVVNLHRIPDGATNQTSLDTERRLLPELRESLTVPVPTIEIYAEDGPNHLPFAGHRMLPGEPVLSASRPPGPNFGRDLGRLLRDLQSFPIERALELGIPLIDGPSMRQERARHYETVIRRVFPIVSCETRTHIERTFETYLNDYTNFDFYPCLVHQDLDMNCLIDTETGELSGVIDFGGAIVGNPALDLWLAWYGFERLNLGNQIAEFVDAAFYVPDDLERQLGEVDFIDFNFPLTDILSGLERNDEAQINEGLEHLNKSVPRGLRCD
jgi:aminoglycoside 2''-phosphotransferase